MSVAPFPQKAETVAQRVGRMQREARQLAREHSAELIEAIAHVEGLAKDIAVQGEPYLPGVVNEARILAEDCVARIERLSIILNRSKS